MCSEIKPGTAEKQELATQAFVKALRDNPKLSKDACWAKGKADNPKLFGDLQAADWMAEDRAEEQEAKDNEPQPNRFSGYHGDMQPQTTRVQNVMCKARQNTDGSLTIQGGFESEIYGVARSLGNTIS